MQHQIASAGVGLELHVVVLVDGRLHHTMRKHDGTWQGGWGRLADAPAFTSVSCANCGNSLHVTAIAENGMVMHNIRNPDGKWQGWGTPPQADGNPFPAHE